MWVPGSMFLYLEGDCHIHDSAKGECTYFVQRGDFDELGVYHAEIELSKTGVLEDTETFQITIYGTAPTGCDDGRVFEYDGRIDLYINTQYDSNIERGVTGDMEVALTINSTYSM